MSIPSEISLSRKGSLIFLGGLFLSVIATSPFAVDHNLTVRQLLLALTLLCTVFILLEQTNIQQINVDPVILFYFLFVCWSSLSVSWSNTASETFFNASREFLGFIVFLLAVFFLKTGKEKFIALLFKGSVILLLVLTVAGSLQLLSAGSLQRSELYSVTGLNAHKNLFGSFLFLNLFFLINGLKSSTGIWKITGIISIILSICWLVVLQSKALLLGSIGCLFVYTFFSWKIYIPENFTKRKYIIALMICVMITNIFFIKIFPDMLDKVVENSSGKENSLARAAASFDEERMLLWKKTYDLWEKHPLKGVGTGNWQVFFPDETLTGFWRAEDLNITFQRPHNDLLWILSETGLIGLNLFLFFVLSLLIHLIFSIRNSPGLTSKLSAAFIVGYLLIAFCDFPKERIEHTIFVNLLFAVAYCSLITNEYKVSFFSIKITPTLMVVLLFGIAFSVLIAYLRCAGEMATHDLYEARKRNDARSIITSVEEAESFCYKMDPFSMPLKWYDGNAKVALGENEEAKKAFEEAFKVHPYNRNVLNDLASSLVLANETDKAKTFYNEASRISPRYDEPLLNLTAIYIREKNYDAAQQCLLKVLHDSKRRTQYQQIVNFRP